jgi:dienelactone hydrolase
VKLRLLALAALLASALAALAPVARADGVTTLTGALPDGATWTAEVPAGWNGTLLLYSHGYVSPGSQNPPRDASDPLTAGWLLGHGYALAGSSYAGTGWAVREAIGDQLATLEALGRQIGQPRQTIAWGDSLGGMITAGLVQLAPGRFDGALPLCGVLGGAVGTWNQALDAAFAFKTLLAAGSVQLVHIADPKANLDLAERLLSAAQATPEGRARIALVSALSDIPGWFDPTRPEPAADDYAAQEANQFAANQQVDFAFSFAFRAELEARAGGNPSWNSGVDYRRQLRRSVDRAEVAGLYRAAGLSLDADLDALVTSARIDAEPGAVRYLADWITYDGDLGGVPVLTLHTTGDTLVVAAHERAYAEVVAEAGDRALLRQAFVHRASHCTFTPAERIAGLQALLQRVRTGSWDAATLPERLNAQAAALGPDLNVLGAGVAAGPDFQAYRPAPFLRPFDRPAQGEDLARAS